MAVAVAKATAKAKANVVEMSQVTRLESRHSWLPIWGRLCKVYATFSCNIAQATPQSMQHKMIALHTHTQRVKESEMEARHGSKECICCRQERLKAKAKHSNTTTQFSTSSCLPCCRCCCSLYSSLLDSTPPSAWHSPLPRPEDATRTSNGCCAPLCSTWHTQVHTSLGIY